MNNNLQIKNREKWIFEENHLWMKSKITDHKSVER